MSVMSPAEVVFFAAIDRSSAEARAAYLDEALAGRPELRAQVEKLLAAHAKFGFLDPPPSALPSVTSDMPDPAAGSVVAGRYKLLQQIGEGGMGSVWMADQTDPVKRRVAVKLIRAERGLSRTILTRFEAERQAIALMDHPNIAKLLDAGTAADGSPFFVMELVKGVPLTDFCDAHKLSVPDRLALFVQICSAVQHAHQKGVIHRDLKPTNILVESHDGTPVPKVIDFGLAKAATGLQLTEHTLFTGFGSVMGTPLYMAPEQAAFNAVDVDTRADVYALGVILYELLTGTTPLTRETIKKAALDEMLKLIREQDAPSPSSRLSSADSKPGVAANRQTEPAKLGRIVKGELDWIVMKALSKERDRRYDSAGGFARDVERFLRHEPVQAGPPTAAYRLKKFVRRNRPQVVASSLLVLVLTAGAVGTTFGLIQTARQRNRAVAAEQDARTTLDDLRAEQERTKAALAAETTARKRARAVLHGMTDEVVEKLLARKHELDPDDRAFLRRVLKDFEEFGREHGTTEAARAIAAEGQRRVALVRTTLGESREAADCYRDAIRTYESLLAEFPASTEYRSQLAACLNNLGSLHKQAGASADAERDYRAAIAHAETVVAAAPADYHHQRLLAVSCRHLGSLLDDTGRRHEAAKLYDRATGIQKTLVEQNPRDPRRRQDLADCHNGYAVLLAGINRQADADEQFRLAFALRKQLVADHPKVIQYRRELADSHYNLGILLEKQGASEKAEEHHRQAVAIKQQLAAEHPSVPSFRAELGRTHKTLGSVLNRRKNDADAEKHFRLALAIAQQLADAFPDVVAYRRDAAAASVGLANMFQSAGRAADAEPHYLRAIEAEQKLATDQPEVLVNQLELAKSLVNFGRLLVQQEGREAEALEYYLRALPHAEEAARRDPKNAAAATTLCYANRGRAHALLQLKRYHEALPALDRAIELNTEADARGWLVSQRGLCLAHAGQFAKAHAAVTEVLRGKDYTDRMCYDMARTIALCATAEKSADRKGQAEKMALDLLRMAVKAGYKDARIHTDPELDLLRGRDEFKKLLTDLVK